MPQDLKSLIDELREAEKKATEGPWRIVVRDNETFIRGTRIEDARKHHHPTQDVLICKSELMKQSDEELIILLRNKISVLLDAAEAGMVMRNRMAAIVATGADLSAFEQCKEALAAYDETIKKS